MEVTSGALQLVFVTAGTVLEWVAHHVTSVSAAAFVRSGLSGLYDVSLSDIN